MKLMKFKKTVAKSLVFAMALSFAPTVSFTAKANTPALKFSGTDCSVSATGDPKYWGIAKEVKGKNPEKKGNIMLGKKWYLVKDINEFKEGIDLSAFSKKGVVVAAGTTEAVTNGSWCIKEIKAGAQDFAVQYLGTASTSAIKKIKVEGAVGNDEFGYIGAVRTKGASAGAVKLKDVENVEVKLPNGNWQTVKVYSAGASGKKMPMLVQCGSTLLFRIKGDENTFPSKEVKVKIKAQAKAPNVKYNAKKNELGLKKGCLVATGSSADSCTKFAKVKGKSTLTELGIDGKEDAFVKVKIGPKKNTIASKVQTISLKKQNAPTVVEVKAVTGAVIADKLLASLKTSYDLKKGVIIENKDEKTDYEIFIGSKAPVSKSKWLKVKAAKKGKNGKVTIKYDKNGTKDSIKDNSIASGASVKIYVRIPGSVDKQTGEIKMASELKEANFTPKVVEQKITETYDDKCSGGNITSSTGAAVEGKISLTMTNVVKNGKKPKVKVTQKLNGVSVKAGSFAGGKCDLIVKVNKSKDAIKGTFKFTVSYEGAEKEYTITVKDK